MASTRQPFNNWPNDVAFEVMQEEKSPVELKVSGKIPSYVSGTLYRTGPGGHQVQMDKGTTFSIDHFFDGFSQNHRFQIIQNPNSPPRVIYNSRSSVDPLIEKVRATGKMGGISFGQKRDPCMSFFRKLMSVFFPEQLDFQQTNVGVTIFVDPAGLKDIDTSKGNAKKSGHAPGTKALWVKTDAAALREIDPETLEPMGVVDQTVLHPDLKGNLSSAHSKTDPITGDIYNFNLAFGRTASYRVFRVSASTGQTDVIATITDAPAAYLHSTLITENYYILCIWGAHYGWGGAKILWEQNMVDAIAPFDPAKKALWYVIDRKHGKGVVAKYECDPFFCFHTVNAWEEPSPSDPSQTDIVADLSTYKNLDIIKRFYYDNLKSSAPGVVNFTGENRKGCEIYLKRFRLGQVTAASAGEKKAREADVVHTAEADHSCDLPAINPRFATKPYRYVYGLCDRGLSTFIDGIVKYDNVTHTPLYWSVDGHSPGEAIFVVNPDGTEEDDGVLLSVVLDGHAEKSYLLVLDAKTMKEVGRASMERAVGIGLHGTYHSASL